ncbi:hypothetical protein [Streptomyces sp. NPDC005374]|uniref:hypothetical protein n=1 Tax=Streptomyces sp. NPDC005374 TaxID=3364713 RepID=UPI0036BCFD6D
MSRLSREKKLDHQRGATPIDVRVPVTGEVATVAGSPVTAPPGEELQQAVLTHLHRLARTAGGPVHATIHDARIGYVVPLEVTTDGSSRFTADPVRMAPPEGAGEVGPAAEEPGAPAPTTGSGVTGPAGLAPEVSWPAAGGQDEPAPHDRPEHSAQPPVEPTPDPAPTFRFRKLPEDRRTDAEPSPTQVLRRLPGIGATGPTPARTPGTAVPPTGEFGPPPVMGTRPASEALPEPGFAPAPGPLPTTGSDAAPAPAWPAPVPTPLPLPTDPGLAPTPLPLPTEPGPVPALRPLPSAAGFVDVSQPRPLPSAQSTPRTAPLLDPVPLLDDPGPQPTPVRGFDAVAEAVLGEGLVVDDAVLVEPVARISEAVQEGRTDVAAELAERAVAQASDILGGEHPDVLRVRELAAYIAYLGGELIQAVEISLDLAAIQHRAGDAEAAYGNVQSAATAWKAVQDPLRGLELGRELLTLWTDMAAGEGPAAEDLDRLESARARMLRLTERARTADQ